jgi:CheY-like chemotaxis protein
MAAMVLIAVTGYGQERNRMQALAAGFDHHLVKPRDAQKLVFILTKVGVS